MMRFSCTFHVKMTCIFYTNYRMKIYFTDEIQKVAGQHQINRLIMLLKMRIMHKPGCSVSMMVVSARKTESADAMLSFERSQFRK